VRLGRYLYTLVKHYDPNLGSAVNVERLTVPQ